MSFFLQIIICEQVGVSGNDRAELGVRPPVLDAEASDGSQCLSIGWAHSYVYAEANNSNAHADNPKFSLPLRAWFALLHLHVVVQPFRSGNPTRTPVHHGIPRHLAKVLQSCLGL